MSVYVDGLKRRGWVLHRKMVKSAHLTADTLDELHEFARLIGLRPEWYQDHRSHPHFDVTAKYWSLAVRHGATHRGR